MTWSEDLLMVSLAAILSGCAPDPSQLIGNRTELAVPPAAPTATLAGDPAAQPAGGSFSPADGWFADITDRSGIDFTYRNGREAEQFLMLESFGGGAAIVDFDRDGLADVFFTGGGTITPGSSVEIGGRPSGLFRNTGALAFVDVTPSAGLSAPPGYSQGCAVSDFNVDGFPDLFVCCYGRSRLYENLGDGSFEPLSESELPASGWGTAAALADFDHDGFPDLLLARYTAWTPASDVVCRGPHDIRDLCGPTSYPGTAGQFFHNSGHGAFEDWSERMHLAGDMHGLGVAASDLNGDGWVDFYVSSDGLPNHLHLGGPDQQLTDCGASAGVAFGEWGQPEAGMGIAIGDYDGDARPDIFVTNFESEDNALYRSLGQGVWMHRTVSAGLAGASRMLVGFGVCLADFDSDSWPDLFVLNGNPIYTTAKSPFEQHPQLFHNAGQGRFEDISAQGGAYFGEAHSGRGCAAGDLDNDGAPDLLVVLMNEPVRVLQNRRPPANFVSVRLVGVRCEREAVGAEVTAEVGGRIVAQWISRGTSFFSQDDSRILIPLATGTLSADVIVHWPGGRAERFSELHARRSHSLVEFTGELVVESP